jgi:hypothetical protein
MRIKAPESLSPPLSQNLSSTTLRPLQRPSVGKWLTNNEFLYNASSVEGRSRPQISAAIINKFVSNLQKARRDWLGRQDSNLRMPASKAGALPLGDAPTA